MLRRPFAPLVLTVLVSLATVLESRAQFTPKTKIEEVYTTLCAACHGAKLEGGQGGSLVDGTWKHGGTDEDISRIITKGIPELGMVAWAGVLSPDQIRTMVVFIRENEKRALARGATPAPRPEPGKVTTTKLHSYRTEILTEGLQTPWSLAFLPDGRMLVTEKAGPVRFIAADGKLDPEPLSGTPAVQAIGQGGMMEVAPHPDFAKNGWVYLSFSDGVQRPDGKPRALTAVVRGRIRDHKWTDEQTIYRADPKFYTGAGVHFGSRIVFDQGYIYFVVGERNGRMEVQDVKRPNGKIFRLHDDGRVPADNPFVDVAGAEKGIWSYGHRNPQGLALDTRDHSLYSTEHGPRGGDEFNLILKGRNYGWPVITYGMDYNGTAISALTAKEGMEQPLTYWVPSIATCGLAFYDAEKFPQWRGDFFAGGLAGQQVVRLRLENGKVTGQEIILRDIGRIRDVRTGPDGNLYLLTNAPDRLVRLVPAEQ